MLESRETVPAVRRFQDRREHSSLGLQPRNGVDGHVLLARFANHQRGQTNYLDVRTVLGGAHVQRATRRRVSG